MAGEDSWRWTAITLVSYLLEKEKQNSETELIFNSAKNALSRMEQLLERSSTF